MRKIYITGDTHIPVDMKKLLLFRPKNATKEDFLIVCGDFGLIWNWMVCGLVHDLTESSYSDERWTERELEWKRLLEELPYTILFIDGNHENFSRLESYPISEWNGGKVHKISDSIIHLMRGQVYQIDDKKIFTFGGARSVDRGPATGTEDLDEGVCWWPQELCSQKERDEAIVNLAAAGNKVDYIITHCLPDRQSMQLGYIDFNAHTNFLSSIEDIVDYTLWFCGHYHIDEWISTKHRVLYNDILDIETGEKVG